MMPFPFKFNKIDTIEYKYDLEGCSRITLSGKLSLYPHLYYIFKTNLENKDFNFDEHESKNKGMFFVLWGDVLSLLLVYFIIYVIYCSLHMVGFSSLLSPQSSLLLHNCWAGIHRL